jgi:cell division protein FtsW (lipid II flippase)
MPTCTVTAPPTITGSTAVTATLTVESTAPATSASQDHSRSIFFAGGGLTLASLFCFFAVPRAWRQGKVLIFLFLLTAVSGFLAGCGGSGASSTGTGIAGTTPGAYVITVTGTSGGTTESTPVSVTIGN